MISIKQNLALDNLRFLPFWAIAKLPELLHKPWTLNKNGASDA
jgi:hypothetical protein